MARGQSSKRQKVVPECHPMLDQLKYEIAAEMGLPVGGSTASAAVDTEFASELGTGSQGASFGRNESYWGHISSRDAGAVGGAITSRLIRQAEQSTFDLS